MSVKAQDVAVKSNLLYDAMLTLDLGVEVGVAPQWSVELTGNLNAWTVNDRRWKHGTSSPRPATGSARPSQDISWQLISSADNTT